jgi:hypothetical protein
MWNTDTVLLCALSLLSRSAASFPPIEFVDVRPAYVSALAEAYVLPHDTRIHLITTSPVFMRARRAGARCGELQTIRKIASILVHEEWHVRHGASEEGAYSAQLSALISIHAGPGNPVFAEVLRSMRAVTRLSSQDERRRPQRTGTISP